MIFFPFLCHVSLLYDIVSITFWKLPSPVLTISFIIIFFNFFCPYSVSINVSPSKHNPMGSPIAWSQYHFDGDVIVAALSNIGISENGPVFPVAFCHIACPKKPLSPANSVAP